MTRPAYLVDGHLEKTFIQRTCRRNTVVRLLQCNGEDVAVQAIAKRIVTHCRLLHGRCRPIIVVLDREGRDTSAEQLSADIIVEVQKGGVDDEIIIGVADRNIENWILADVDTVQKLYPNVTLDIPSPDGFNGKSKLRKALGTYHETTMGVDLLLRCRSSSMRSSPSFSRFLKKVQHLDCWWLEK